MPSACNKKLSFNCPEQKPWELEYPTCEAAQAAQHRIAQTAKGCSISFASSSLGGHRKKAKKAQR